MAFLSVTPGSLSVTNEILKRDFTYVRIGRDMDLPRANALGSAKYYTRNAPNNVRVHEE